MKGSADLVLSPETNLHVGQQPITSNKENTESTSIQLLDLPHTTGNQSSFSTEQRSETHVRYTEQECQNQTSSLHRHLQPLHDPRPHIDW